MTRNAIVLSNGELKKPHIMQRRLEKWRDALVIAADDGTSLAKPLGLSPDVIIGDMDSLAPAVKETYEADSVRIITSPVEKDETDLELALLHAAEAGVERTVVIGGLGGRADMTVANLLLLAHPGLSHMHIEFWAGEQTIWLITPPGDDINGLAGDTLSLIPIGRNAVGIITHRLKYPLKNETLAFGPARGLSNVMEDDAARVDLREGVLLAVHTPGRA